MVILITGASSYVGASIYAEMKKRFDTVGTYHTTRLFPELEFLDVRDAKSVEAYIKAKKPDRIIHVAANPSANWCEKNPTEAHDLNAQGTLNIVNAANSVNAKIIFISSFASEDSTSIYGRTKSAAESYVKETTAGYIILRPSLILGYSPNTSNDRPFNRLLKNITHHTPAVYDTSWKFQPTWLKHIDEVIESVITRDVINETISIAVPEVKSRFDIARDVLVTFSIKVVPEDKHDTQPLFVDSLTKLKELGLPQHTYAEMIQGIQREIQNYLKKGNP